MSQHLEIFMPTALVTGCAGFIGSHLVEELLDQNWKVFGIDNFHPYYSKQLKELNLIKAKQNSNFKFIFGSILNDDDITKLPPDIDYVFHFAAIAGVRNSFINPEEYYEINVEGTKKILKKYPKTKKFVFASSSSVYGEVKSEDFPVNENYPLNPIAPYGDSKKVAEEFCMDFSKSYESKIVILRF